MDVFLNQSKIKLKSRSHICHTELRDEDVLTTKFKSKGENEALYYLEIEGLKMTFTDLTKNIKSRQGIKGDSITTWKRDHTTAVLIYDSPNINSCNTFKFTFFPCDENENIYVKLPNSMDDGLNILYYNLYIEFKQDLVSFLSLLNGAEVAIRKEFLGVYCDIDRVNSQKTKIYSFKSIKNKSFSKYLPLNHTKNIGEEILNYAFVHCFNNFVSVNKQLDLNSIIFYLNGAENAKSVEEKFFIKIIALERLSFKYKNLIKLSDEFIIENSTYTNIKVELLNVLDNNKDESNSVAIEKLKGKIGELHIIKHTSTEFKFKKLLDYANIELTPEIDKIIEQSRHKSVHEGEIEQGNEGLKNYFILDELLRDIILNLIKYNKTRTSSYK